nr:lisH domain-containing protein C1711.05-like isoform X1 [Paramormyrops kingsleyae]
MKIAVIIVCLLGTVLSNPVSRRNVPDAAGERIGAETSRESLHETHSQSSSKQQSNEQSKASDSTSSQDNTSEKTASDSVQSTSEDKTSEELNGYLRDKQSDSNEDGNTRDDSRGSRESSRNRFYRIFRVNAGGTEDGANPMDTQNQSPSSEDTDEDLDSIVKPTEADSVESAEGSDSKAEGYASDAQPCQQFGGENDDDSRSCESDSSEDIGDDDQRRAHDLLTYEHYYKR